MNSAAAPDDVELLPSPQPGELPLLFLMTDSFSTGGSERQFCALARELNRDCFRIQIGCIQKKGGFLQGFENAIDFPLGGNVYGPASWRTRLRLARHLRRSRASIAHAFDFYTNLALVPVARVAGVPVVIGSHRQIGDLLGPTQSLAQLAAYRFCDRVICNSHAAARTLLENGIPARRVVVIRNGLLPLAFAATDPAVAKSPGVLRVGMIARMNTPAKNHILFLKAAARIAASFPQIEFLLAGDGPLRASLEIEAETLGLNHCVRFLGDRRDIPSVLASLDLSVLPSQSESLSNAILESMAAGIPVIASEVGGNPELLGSGRGFLVNPGSSEALAAAMKTALSDSGWRAQVSAKARKFALENFTIEGMCRQHEELYHELLLEKNWRPTISGAGPHSSPGRIRVAIVAASPRYVGGQSVQAELLERGWTNDDRVEASFIPIDPELPRGLRWAETIPGLRTALRQPLYLSNLWYGLRHVDVAHLFSASYWSFLVAPMPAWALARARGARVVIHYHSGEARDHLRRFRSARPVLARVDKVVVPTGFLVDVFREYGVPAEIVPNVIDRLQFRFRLREPLRPHLICTRGFHPYYCMDVVVRAFREIQNVFPDAKLDLVGGGRTESEIRMLVNHLKLTNVRFHGVVPRNEIANYYEQSDIFINASRLDNMPVSVLEAFASGTPVVSTAPEGMCYLIKDGRTGLLSEPGDAEALARNVLRLLNDPALSVRLAKHALEECKSYEWAAVRQQWLGIYESVLGVVPPDGDPQNPQVLLTSQPEYGAHNTHQDRVRL